ncbi:MAG: hypothetical protein QOK07_544 [Gemmatimonadaceae bacterium]|jgi:hypothetical protein|nr:hypothetical protein [Gemmatimonadaceae bacterium]
MRSTILIGAVIVTAVITGCSSSGGVQVRTSVEPDANLGGLHTFYVLTAPQRSANAPLSSTDPMLDNSITNRALRGDLTTALESRGYAPTSRQGADFLVAYYAGTSQKLDTTYWGPTFDPGWRYQYRGRRGWAWPYYGAAYYGPMNPWGGQQMSVTSSTQGQVIVDLTDPRTNELIWRGQGVEPVSTDPAQYANQLQGVVSAIVARFPQATQPVATSSQ